MKAMSLAFATRAVALVILAIMFSPSPAAAKMGGGKGGFGGGSGGGPSGDPVERYFPGYDTNSDGRLDRQEWGRRGNFDRLDTDKNGTIERSEFRQLYEDWGRKEPMANPIRPADPPVMDASLETSRLSPKDLGKSKLCPIIRMGIMGRFKCEDGDAQAEEAGLIETGIGPVFPPKAFCNGIDETYALDYTDKTGIGRHGGIDLPTDFGTPMLAVAAGTVVGKFDPERHARGKTVVLRHSPEDTGLPFWVYTEYGHMDEMPAHEIGQRVRMGEILGPTGNSGMAAKNRSGVNRRRPGIHFAVYYSESPEFAVVPNYVVPKDGRWMDPNALYRKSPPYDSAALKALPEAEKEIPVPVMFLDGAVEPSGSKLIWPYACRRD
jgi:hypothetical protein